LALYFATIATLLLLTVLIIKTYLTIVRIVRGKTMTPTYETIVERELEILELKDSLRDLLRIVEANYGMLAGSMPECIQARKVLKNEKR
jgi:cell division protein FtsL